MRSVLLIAAVLLLMAAFLTRRLMVPRTMSSWRARTPERGAAPQIPQTEARAPAPKTNGPSEHITDSDRRALDEVIRRRSGAQ